MKKLIVLIVIATLYSCQSSQDNITNQTTTETQVETKNQNGDNQELIEIYKNDQADRQTMDIDWKVVSKRDKAREARVYELLAENKVLTSHDYHNAAMVFQHGDDSTAYGMAVKMMRKSLELDPTGNKWLLAAAIDRDLLSRNKPQIYGTQYRRNSGEPWELSELDSTQVTDEERIEYGVETLAQQREKVKQMNLKKLSELLNEGKTVDELIQVIKKTNRKDSEYDLSEGGINSFGYQLMSSGKDAEALKIFKLNTELYPDGYNTFDSYGECLMKMGDKKNGIIAYKKSLELNPGNTGAKKMIEENEDSL